MNSVIKHHFNSLWALRESSDPFFLQEPPFFKRLLKKINPYPFNLLTSRTTSFLVSIPLHTSLAYYLLNILAHETQVCSIFPTLSEARE